MSLTFASQVLRFDKWWKSKIPLYLSLFLLYSSPSGLSYDFTRNLVILFLWLVSAAALGHFINDWFDIDEDLASNKKNYVSQLGQSVRFLLLLALSSIALAPWVIIGYYQIFILVSGQILLFFLYSLPPFRLKKHLYLGVIADAGYAFILPTIVVILFADNSRQIPPIAYGTAVLWATAAGLRAIISHHINDRKIDKNISPGNVVNRYGIALNIRLCNVLLLPEMLAFGFILSASVNVVLSAIAFVVYLLSQLLLINTYGIRFSAKKKLLTGQILLFEFYERWLPMVVLLGLITADWRFIFPSLVFLLLFQLAAYYHLYHFTKVFFSSVFHHVVLRSVYFLKHIVYHVVIRKTYFFFKRLVLALYYHVFLPGSFYVWYRGVLPIYYFLRYRIATPFVYILIFNVIRPPASLMVNYTIYGYRRLILKMDNSAARAQSLKIPYISDFLNTKPVAKEKNKPAILNKPATQEPQNGTTVLPPKLVSVNILHKKMAELSEDNKVINGLWIGEELSKIELLTINSFIKNGHEFILWTYGPIKTRLPKELTLRDANEILPASRIFRYKYMNTFGHGKGSVSGFSDIFRYKLLHDKGGWWTDMDITCLKPLNIVTPYFFRKHHDLPLVGNLMKCPPGSLLMERCYAEASETINADNRDWHKPIEILSKHVFGIGLNEYIFDGFVNQDKWDEVKSYVRGNESFSQDYLAIHWMNEEWRSRRMDKSDIRFKSTLGGELLRYSLIDLPNKQTDLYLNEFRHKFWLPIYQLFLLED